MEESHNTVDCCRVEAIISVDERGQMVLPKDLREKLNLQAGSKLAVISWGGGDTAWGLFVIKTDRLEDMVKSLLQPVLINIVGNNGAD